MISWYNNTILTDGNRVKRLLRLLDVCCHFFHAMLSSGRIYFPFQAISPSELNLIQFLIQVSSNTLFASLASKTNVPSLFLCKLLLRPRTIVTIMVFEFGAKYYEEPTWSRKRITEMLCSLVKNLLEISVLPLAQLQVFVNYFHQISYPL